MSWVTEVIGHVLKALFFTVWGCLRTILRCFSCSSKKPDLSSDICLITGAGQGLGRQLALKMADCGAASLVLWDIDEEKVVTDSLALTFQLLLLFLLTLLLFLFLLFQSSFTSTFSTSHSIHIFLSCLILFLLFLPPTTTYYTLLLHLIPLSPSPPTPPTPLPPNTTPPLPYPPLSRSPPTPLTPLPPTI